MHMKMVTGNLKNTAAMEQIYNMQQGELILLSISSFRTYNSKYDNP